MRSVQSDLGAPEGPRVRDSVPGGPGEPGAMERPKRVLEGTGAAACRCGGEEAEGNRTDCRVSVSAPPDPESLLGSPIPSMLQAGRGQQHLPSFTHTSQLLDGVL